MRDVNPPVYGPTGEEPGHRGYLDRGCCAAGAAFGHVQVAVWSERQAARVVQSGCIHRCVGGELGLDGKRGKSTLTPALPGLEISGASFE